MDILSWVVAAALIDVTAGLFRELKRLGRQYGRADWGGAFLNHLDGLIRVFCARIHRLEHEPLPVPASGGAIVAANHLSGLDPMILAAASHRPLRVVIAIEQYERPILRWFASWWIVRARRRRPSMRRGARCPRARSSCCFHKTGSVFRKTIADL